jgi:hypothetical protein
MQLNFPVPDILQKFALVRSGPDRLRNPLGTTVLAQVPMITGRATEPEIGHDYVSIEAECLCPDRRLTMSLRTTSIALLLVSAAVGYAPTVSADPTGILYNMTLDGDTTQGNEEGHEGQLTFGAPDPQVLPNDIVPPPPDVPGNPLNVTEMYFPGSIVFWIETQSNDGSLDIFENIVTEVFFDIDGLHWGGEGPATLEFNEIFGANDNGGFEPADVFVIAPVNIIGDGSIFNPFSIQMELDPLAFNQGLSELHVSFNVSHIPIPATLPLLASCLIGLGLVKRRTA